MHTFALVYNIEKMSSPGEDDDETVTSGPVSKKIPALAPAHSVNLKRYVGRWFQIAFLKSELNWFQSDKARNVRADYSLKGKNGDKLTIVNYEEVPADTGRAREISVNQVSGTASIVNPPDNSILSVKFNVQQEDASHGTSSEYWILYVSPTAGSDYVPYQEAIVGEPSRTFMWILSRSKSLSETRYKELIDYAVDHLGYSRTKLSKNMVITQHDT